MQEYILVPGCTHDALEEQWKVVYGYEYEYDRQKKRVGGLSKSNNDDNDNDNDEVSSGAAPGAAVPATVAVTGSDATGSSGKSHQQSSTCSERNLERGGLVFWDGRVNPGHFCFETKEENDKRLSPISKIIIHYCNPQKKIKAITAFTDNTTENNNNIERDDDDGERFGLEGRVRVGRCCDVSAGWDHTDVNGYDPTTFHYTSLVFGHFHIHADDATGEIIKIRNEEQEQHEDEGAEEGTDTIQSEEELLPLKPLLLPPSPPPRLRLLSTQTSSSLPDEHQPYVSVPSCGDVAAWLTYHRNVSRAFVVTRTTSWFFEKNIVDGHAKDGIECPYHIVEPWVVQLQEHEHEPIAATTNHKVGRCDFECIYRQMLQHGFGIFTKHLSFFDNIEYSADNDNTATTTTTKVDFSEEDEENDDERLYTLWRPFEDKKFK